MFAHHPYLKNYLLKALDATPDMIASALAGISNAAADLRPDPDRFTLREAIAHLADFEPIFRERMERIASQDTPLLENRDEEQMAIDNDYAHSNVAEQTQLFIAERAKTVAFLQTLSPELWEKQGKREAVGMISLEDIAHLLVVHDVYHLKQVQDYRKSS